MLSGGKADSVSQATHHFSGQHRNGGGTSPPSRLRSGPPSTEVLTEAMKILSTSICWTLATCAAKGQPAWTARTGRPVLSSGDKFKCRKARTQMTVLSAGPPCHTECSESSLYGYRRPRGQPSRLTCKDKGSERSLAKGLEFNHLEIRGRALQAETMLMWTHRGREEQGMRGGQQVWGPPRKARRLGIRLFSLAQHRCTCCLFRRRPTGIARDTLASTGHTGFCLSPQECEGPRESPQRGLFSACLTEQPFPSPIPSGFREHAV